MRNIALSVTLFFITFTGMHAPRAEQSTRRYRIIADKGATLRAKPDVKSASIGKIAHGEVVSVLEFLNTEVILKLDDYGYQGKWARLENAGKDAYLFSALIEPAEIDEYICEKPKKPIDIHIRTMTAEIDFCPDGTFVSSDFYNCGGPCTNHGCWRETKGKIELTYRKNFFFEGIGSPETVTHAAYFKNYLPVSRAVTDSRGVAEYSRLAAAKKYMAGQGDTPSSDEEDFREVGPRKRGSLCRRSYLFGNR